MTEPDEIDELVRAAAKAHEALAPADHFDGLSARVMARLARDDGEVSMMSETNKDAPLAASPPPTDGKPERSEDSGVHDMKALAQTAKQRISRRITSQHDAYEESLLSSSQSGLRAVALPVQAQVVSLPAMPTSIPGAAEITGAEAAGITPIEAVRGKKSKAVWLVAGGGVLAAAAAAIFFIAASGQKKDNGAQMAAAAGSGAPAMGREAAGAVDTMAGAAAGTAAAPEGAAAGSATTVVALDPAAPPPADEAGKAELKAQDTAAGEKAGGSRSDGRGAGSARVSGDAGGATDKQVGKAKESIKAGGGGGGAGGGAGGGGGAAPKGPGGSSMEELLAAASGGAQKPTEGGDSGGAPKPEKTGLDGKDIRTGMSAVAKQAQACYDQHGVTGHVKIKATVDPSGKVTKADATGEFAGTPTGTCVAAAAKSASFPEWSGAPMTISYGFTLVE